MKYGAWLGLGVKNNYLATIIETLKIALSEQFWYNYIGRMKECKVDDWGHFGAKSPYFIIGRQ